MKTAYRSEALAALHETMEGLHEVEAIDKETLQMFDEHCLVAVPSLTASDIKALREREQVSQAVFARYLNVSRTLVSDWEKGLERPGGPALRLLALVEKRGLEDIV